MQRLPNLHGFKSEVIIPEYSHNVYDHAIRMLGVKTVIVKDKAELEAAFNERTAMVYILAGPGDTGPLGTQVVAEMARQKRSVLVDAAAEVLTLTQRAPGARREPWRTAAASAFAVRSARGSCWATRTCCRPRGPIARRTTRLGDLSRSARKRSWACWRRWRRGPSATTKPNGRSGRRGSITFRKRDEVDGVTRSETAVSDLSNRSPSW